MFRLLVYIHLVFMKSGHVPVPFFACVNCVLSSDSLLRDFSSMFSFPRFRFCNSLIFFLFFPLFRLLRLAAVRAWARQGLLAARRILGRISGFQYATSFASMVPILTGDGLQQCRWMVIAGLCGLPGSGAIAVL